MEALDIVWSDMAKDSIEAIYLHLKRTSSKENAKRTIKGIRQKCLALLSFPHLGPIDPWFENRRYQYRFLMADQFRIVYRIESTKILIINVIDGRMNPDRYFVTGER